MEDLDLLLQRVQNQAVGWRDLVTLTYKEFLRQVGQMNRMCQALFDKPGDQLVFAVKKGTDESMFWKATVQIGCCLVNSSTKTVNSHRLLNLRQFQRVYKTVQEQVMELGRAAEVIPSPPPSPARDNTSDSEASAFASSQFLPSLKDIKGQPLTATMILEEAKLEFGNDLEECCICLERKPDAILPCMHSYCSKCIDQWQSSSATCPVCREKVDASDDSWVISDIPDMGEMSKEIERGLHELASGP